jgi:hypothetical protein
MVDQARQIERASGERNTWQVASATLYFAPMLGITFVACRVRALQIDPVNGNPLAYMQYAFYSATGALVLSTAIVLAVPLLSSTSAVKGDKPSTLEGAEVDEEDPNVEIYSTTGSALDSVVRFCNMLRWSCVAVVYASISLIMGGFLHMAQMPGTPPMSTASWCVLVLATMFFAVQVMHFVATAIRHIDLDPKWETFHSATLELCHAVYAAPMLSCLILLARMRALQITHNRGSPQPWAKQLMHIAVAAVVLQCALCLGVALLSGSPPTVEKPGFSRLSPSTRKAYPGIVVPFAVVRAVILVMLYGAVAGICYSMFTIRYDTATPISAFSTIVEALQQGSA